MATRVSALVLVLLAVACGGGTQGNKYTRKTEVLDPVEAQAKLITELLEYTAGHDDRGLAHMLATPLGYGGLWFPDTTCRRQFGPAGTIPESGIDIFARCLASLTLTRSAHAHQYPDVAVFTYEPGVEIEALFDPADGGHIRWIGFVGRRDLKDALPTVTQDSLLALRNEVAPLVVEDATRAEIDQEIQRQGGAGSPIYAWFKVCVDATGAVTGVHPRVASSLVAQEVLGTWIKTWSFRSYKLGEQPSPVCSLVYLDLPEGSTKGATAMMPPPMPPELGDATVVPIAAFGPVLEGDRAVEPTPAIKDDLGPVARTLQPILLVCLDEIGKVGPPTVMRSSGVPAYDKQLVAAVATWRYAPFTFRGAPVRACSHLTFNYVHAAIVKK